MDDNISFSTSHLSFDFNIFLLQHSLKLFFSALYFHLFPSFHLGPRISLFSILIIYNFKLRIRIATLNSNFISGKDIKKSKVYALDA